MKINNLFNLRRLSLILVIASISYFAYSLLLSKSHRLEAIAQANKLSIRQINAQIFTLQRVIKLNLSPFLPQRSTLHVF